ncbi:MAG: hypothetical protein JJT93_03910 [Gammaproteobacteria bacterium]|nr:hypothetical protein [Gammaproteobacteria bacterium]
MIFSMVARKLWRQNCAMLRVFFLTVVVLVGMPACASNPIADRGDVDAAPDDLDCVAHYWTLAMLLPPQDSEIAGERLRTAAIAHGRSHPGISEQTLTAEVQPIAQARARRIYARDEPLAALDADLAACDARYDFEHHPLSF